MPIAEWHDKKVEDKINKALKQRLDYIGFTLSSYIKRSMKPGGYKAYRRGKKVHWSSFPGHPPAVDSGRLRNSITHKVSWKAVPKVPDEIESPPDIKGMWVVAVGSDVEYALRLELGDDKVEPRPFLRPALEAHTSLIRRLLVDKPVE